MVVKTPADLSTAILDGVNRARATAHFSALTLDPKQSVENARLAGTLINGTLLAEAKEGSDRAALRLLAGWDVAGMIRSATISVTALAPTRDVEATNIDQVPIPEMATRAGPLHIAVAVTHHRAKDAAWGQYVIFFVVVGGNVDPSTRAMN